MARVICTLPNASTLINGVAFIEDRGQMISAEISAEVAANFASIPGYELVGAKKAAPEADAGGEPSAETATAAPTVASETAAPRRSRPRKDAAGADAPAEVATETPVQDAPAAETGSETQPAVEDGFGDPE